MTRPLQSWLGTVLLFLFTAASYLGFSACLPRLRHQMLSTHSSYWTFDLPWCLGSLAVTLLLWHILSNRLMRRHSPPSER